MAEEKNKTIGGSQSQKGVTPQAEGELSDAAVEQVRGGDGKVQTADISITKVQDAASATIFQN